MAASLPVIASNVGFNQQVVSKDAGYLVDDNHSTSGWKDAILELSVRWEHYLRMSRRAKERYDAYFSYDKNKSFWMELVNKQQN